MESKRRERLFRPVAIPPFKMMDLSTIELTNRRASMFHQNRSVTACGYIINGEWNTIRCGNIHRHFASPDVEAVYEFNKFSAKNWYQL